MTKAALKEADALASAKEQGQAQFDSIKEMVEALEKANEQAQYRKDGNYDEANEDARRVIEEDALSVQVRPHWYSPGDLHADRAPAEYEILLCTGGPACRIVGQLSSYGEPETATMEVQDWYQPWTAMRPRVGPDNYDSEPVMLAYARCFYFGEG